MNHEFEIHAPRISEEELEAIIRRRLASRNLDPAEIERVESLSFSPLSGTGMKGFDPAETADLFERSATVPNFRSGKFRWLKGPLAGLARWIYRLSSALMDKLSEHKIEAFYNVIGELIFLRRQVSDLQARLGGDAGAYQRSGDLYSVPTMQGLDMDRDPLYRHSQSLLELLDENQIQAPLSIIDDAGGYLQMAASGAGLENDSIASMDLIFQDSFYLRPGSVVAIPSFQNLRCSPAYLISALRRFAGQNSYLLIGTDLASDEYTESLQAICFGRGYELLDQKKDSERQRFLFILR
ncbi:MAG: hypothetical protein CMF59_10185 [Leptospiraceae bacterium]|nr:hypothetical protein [Leptospiraceae bacterium]